MRRAVILNIGLTAIVFLANFFLPAAIRAEGVRFNANFQHSSSTNDINLKSTGQDIDSEFYRLDQRYNLDISKNIFPHLTFATGAIYESNQSTSTTQNLEIDVNEEVLRPFVDLNLNNPLYRAGLSYRKNRIEEQTTNLPDTRADRDEFTATAGMAPTATLPEWNFTFLRTLSYDEPVTVDRREDVYFFDSQYTPLRNLLLDYTYTRNENENRIRNFETTEQNHFGRIEYSDKFLNERLFMSTAYRIRYNTLEVPSGQTVEIPVAPTAGLSSLDNTPDDGPALGSNPALIDGNLVASAGLNIGTTGDQSTDVNIGLDFGFPVDVEEIRIWVDRRLTAAVVNSFSWGIYTSPDNLDTSTWTLVATVSPAEFGVLDDRFEIVFPAVNTRYIKVVTRPLLPAVPDATNFPNIFITEMEAFGSVSTTDDDDKTTTVEHNINLNLRGRLSDKTTVGYNLLYSRQRQDPFDLERSQMTNDLYLNHFINPIFTTNANVQRTDLDIFDDDTVSYSYGASLKAAWLKTFDQSLTYSGKIDREEEGRARQNSIFLRSNANLYKGWSAFLDTGYSWDSSLDGLDTNSTIVKGGTNIVPHRKLTLDLGYAYKKTDQSGLRTGSNSERQFNFQGFYLPFRNLSFFAEISTLDRDDRSDTFQNYSLNWSPFTDGDLQFFFVYSELLRPESDQTQRVYGPSLKWTIGRHIFFDATYTLNQTEDQLQTTDSKFFTAELKLIF